MNLPRQPIFSMRKITGFCLLALLVISYARIGPFPWSESRWAQGGFGEYWELTLKPFLSAALQPTLFDQNPSLPEGATPFYLRLLSDLGATIRYSLIAMSLAVPAGLVLGFLASTAWWPHSAGRGLFKAIVIPLNIAVRFFMTLMRSIHELIWAIIFLIALGDEPITACVALSFPFAGTLGKVFSEIIDEQLPQARDQLVNSGANSVKAFFHALLPQSLPDMATYTLYRFECALRSSAVLGFVGIETIGMSIHRSFENLYYREVWTELYLLIAVIVCVDVIGAKVRKCLHTIPERKKACPDANSMRDARAIALLKKSAPRWQLPRIVSFTILALIIVSWAPSIFGIDAKAVAGNHPNSLTPERADIFIKLITPEPVRLTGQWDGVKSWAGNLWQESGKEALYNTVAMATAAIILAGLFAIFALPWASRALARAKAMGIPSGQGSTLKRNSWRGLGFVTRSGFILTRAIPEYIYAYILIGLLGVSAWPLIIAIALHNFGILGRLWGEVMENQSHINARHMLASGARRSQVYVSAFLPESFNRFLMYLFYRWETCIRETTVLGMLGVASLGLEISLARGFHRAYDEMFFYVLLGASVIFIGDLISVYARRALAKA